MNLTHIKKICKSNGVTLTPLREKVLALIYASDSPLGAYELLRTLRKYRPNAEPPTIYRTLEFLTENHLIHRIDSANTYTACTHPEDIHTGQFLLCSRCGNAIEIEDKRISRAIKACADEYAFLLDHHAIEIRGTCKKCQLIK